MYQLSRGAIMCLAVIMLLFGSISCASMPEGSAAAPSPFETKILARTTVTGALLLADPATKDVAQFQEILLLMKDAALLAVSEPSDGTGVPGEELFQGLNPLYAGIAYDLMELTLLRVGPLIDRDDPDLMSAMEYVNAVFSGAAQGAERVLQFQNHASHPRYHLANYPEVPKSLPRILGIRKLPP